MQAGITILHGFALAALALASPPQAATAAPLNLAPNSQWEIWSAVGFGAQQNPEGSGAEAPITSSGYTGGRTATFTVETTGNLSVGDLVTVSGTGVDSALTSMPMRVIALQPGVSITVRVPLGRSPQDAVRTASSIQTVGVGAQWYETNATGDGPDGWARFPTGAATGPILWREFGRGSHAVNRPDMVTPYALLGARLRQAGHNYVYTDQTANIARYAGMTISFGIFSMQRTKRGGGSYKVFFNDSVKGITPCAPSTASLGAWNWIECTYSVPANATFLFAGVDMDGTIGDTFFFCNPILTIGRAIGGVTRYVKPANEILVPKVHITPLGPWNGARDEGRIVFPTSTVVRGNLGNWYGFYHDPYAESGGQVAPTVAYIWGQLEGINAGPVQVGTAQVRGMMWYDRSAATPPGHSGSFLPHYVANVKSFTSMDMPLNQADPGYDLRGTGIFQTGVPGDTWTNVALEYDMFLLN